MTHYKSNTQPRRSGARIRHPIPPLSTLPRSSSQLTDTGGNGINDNNTMSPNTTRPYYSTSSTTPHYHTPPDIISGSSLGGDMTLTKKILTTASKTGSTRDLRLLLNDALALTEKLDSVSANVGSRPKSSTERQRLSSSSTVFLKSPGAYSESGRGSVFRAQSLGNSLDSVGRDDDLPSPRYEMSESWLATMATPVRKTAGTTNYLNGHTSPPVPSPATIPRRGSPLLNDTRKSSSCDYATPRPAMSSPNRSPKNSVSPSRKEIRRSPVGPPRTNSREENRGSSSSSSVTPSRSTSNDDNVDTGLDCIAQLEALERDLHSYEPVEYPQRDNLSDHKRDGSQEVEGRYQHHKVDSSQVGSHGNYHSLENGSQGSSEESHYEVDPHFTPTRKKEKERSIPPSERVGGGRPTIKDFVDELTEVEKQVSHDQTNDPPRGRGMTSSTATRELDELMANLSNFEPASSSSTATAGKSDQSGGGGRDAGKMKSAVAMDNLNSMLGSLDEDMSKRHGVDTTAKGVCAACNKPILTKVINALGYQWHKEHFVCAHEQCGIELGNTTYYESNGKPYCEKDYHELFAPRCAYCNGPILERVLRALGKTWHKKHFFCTLCGKDFGPEGFHEKDSKAFCRECYYEKFAPRCKRCEKAIMEGFITALSSQWHPECFCCKVCSVTFPRGNYFDHEGEPHCEIHYHASRGTLCASCQKPVTGKCITAMGRKWHPEHFTCAFCLKLLNKGTFKEHRHNPYCQACYIKLFG